jgi:hypothetical protein
MPRTARYAPIANARSSTFVADPTNEPPLRSDPAAIIERGRTHRPLTALAVLITAAVRVVVTGAVDGRRAVGPVRRGAPSSPPNDGAGRIVAHELAPCLAEPALASQIAPASRRPEDSRSGQMTVTLGVRPGGRVEVFVVCHAPTIDGVPADDRTKSRPCRGLVPARPPSGRGPRRRRANGLARAWLAKAEAPPDLPPPLWSSSQR